MDKLGPFVVNHWELFLALAVTIALILYNELLARPRGVGQTGPHAATTLISHEDALVLDVREDHEYKGGHIVDSVHIPLSRLKQRLGEVERYRERPVIIGCRSGHRSGRACNLLKKHGFEKVYNLDGGINAWRNANLPLTTKSKKGK